MEQFPDIIVLDDRRLRCITDKAARWVESQSGLDMTKHRRSILVLQEDDELLLDAYMSGLILRDCSGHYYR